MIEQANQAGIAHEFWQDRIRALGAGYAVEQVTAGEFDDAYQMMRFMRKRAFQLTQQLEPTDRDQVRLERQNRDVARFRAEA